MPVFKLQRRALHSPENRASASFKLSSERDACEGVVVRASAQISNQNVCLGGPLAGVQGKKKKPQKQNKPGKQHVFSLSPSPSIFMMVHCGLAVAGANTPLLIHPCSNSTTAACAARVLQLIPPLNSSDTGNAQQAIPAMVTVAGNEGKLERAKGKEDVLIMQQMTEDIKSYLKSIFLNQKERSFFKFSSL